MKINVISDIHAGILHKNIIYPNGFDPSKLKSADYLLIAGDLGHSDTYKLIYNDIYNKVNNKFNNIFFIKGNHDYWDIFYNSEINYDDRYLEELLDDDTVLIGCTLWSPINDHPLTVSKYINDYRYIPNYSIDKNNKNYKIESNWLRNKYYYYKNLGKKIIIMTHNNPLKELIPEKFKGNIINESFTVMDGSLDDIKPDLWICGHTHAICDNIINGVRYVRNPIGYANELNSKNWYNKIIKIK